MNQILPVLAGKHCAQQLNDGACTHDSMALRRRNICICANDFGVHASIDTAILALAQRRRIGAIGCVVDGLSWKENAPSLHSLPKDRFDIGLQFNLTQTFWSQLNHKHPLHYLIAASYFQKLDPSWLLTEIVRQLDSFEGLMQRMPAFISAHGYVHQLPQIRQALFQELKQRYSKESTLPWLLCTRTRMRKSRMLGPGWMNAINAHAIAWLGGSSFAEHASEQGFTVNRAVAGVYGLDATTFEYQQLFAMWLQQCQQDDVLICHPGSTVVPDDIIAHARCIEYQVLMAESFDQLIEQTNVHIGPLSPSLYS